MVNGVAVNCLTPSARLAIPPMTSADFCLRARWVLPMIGEPVPGGAVHVSEGRIVAIDDRPARGAVELPDCVLIPGLVNAHTHLEFGDLSTPLRPTRPFAEWIRSVISHRLQHPDRDAAIQTGLTESQSAGVASIGEIATAPWSERLDPGATNGVLFRELLGMRPQAVESQLQIAREHLGGEGPLGWTRGLSPHAPYSVHPELLRGIVELAREHHCPLAMHVAETGEEIQFLAERSGPLAKLLDELEIEFRGVANLARSPLDVLKTLAEAPRVLVIHGNYLDAPALAFLSRHAHMSLIYCPRTHAYFGHPRYPLGDAMAAGINVAMGTDSRASNPDLSLFREAQTVAAAFPEIRAENVLRMATVNGARALGQEDRSGVLLPVRAARLIAIRIPVSADSDPYEAVLSRESTMAMVINGSSPHEAKTP